MKNSSNLFEVDRHNNDKRQLFIDATICSLANHGYKGTTVRQIARYADVTPGLLTHYFKGKEALIAESYKYFAKQFLDEFREKVENQKTNPAKALRIFIDSTFDPQSTDPKSLRVWLVFWTLTLTEKELQDAHKVNYRRYIASIEEILNSAVDKNNRVGSVKNTRSMAIGIYGLLDGLWLERCLDPETYSHEYTMETIYDFVHTVTGLDLRTT